MRRVLKTARLPVGVDDPLKCISKIIVTRTLVSVSKYSALRWIVLGETWPGTRKLNVVQTFR